MGFTAEMFNEGTLEVVSFIDPSVKSSRDEYNEYLKTLDRNMLLLEGEPTLFILKKFLTQAETSALRDTMISFDQNKNVNVKLSVQTEEIRRALVDIRTSGANGLAWAKDSGDRWTDKDLIAKLEQLGVVGDLTAARTHATESVKSGLALVKKS
jgi:hypothetical protein